jgi:adenylate cyclase
MGKKLLLSPWTAVVTLLLILAVRIVDSSFVESVRLRYFDTLIVSAPATTSQQIHVVNIDDAAIARLGQFPFPRNQYADIIADLDRRNAGVIVFNVFMPDADRFGGDPALSRQLQKSTVVLPHTATNDPVTVNYLPFRPGVSVIGSGLPGIAYENIQPNVRYLNETASGIGIVNTLPEIDGVVRRIPQVITVGEQLYPSITLETLRVAAGDPSFQVKVNGGIVEAVRIPQFGKIPTDSYGRIWVDWSAQPAQHSLASLPADFQGGIVVVGVTARGLNNPVATARGEVYPHSLQASLLSTVAEGRNIVRPDWADGAEILALALGGILLLFLTRWTYVGMASVVVLVGGSIGGSWFAYHELLWLFDSTAFAVGTVLVALHAYGIKFVSEFLQKQAIKKQFAGYASPTVVRLLQENPDLIKRGTKREVSICFSDLRGFTPLGESFGNDVGGLTRVMNGYMDAISQPILEANGMVIKYIGDASMHIHNAPIDDPEHPKTVVAVGLKMVHAVKEYSKTLEAAGRPGVKMGAGINTGLGYIGEMGSTQRHSYDVLGDAVSTTARIESKCKEYGCVLLVGEETVRRCGDDFFFLKIDDLAVKGKSVGVGIYTVLDEVTAADYQSRLTHDKMHQLYRLQQFDAAIILCEQLMPAFDKRMADYYTMWIERCEFQKTQNLPADWNGVFVASTK